MNNRSGTFDSETVSNFVMHEPNRLRLLERLWHDKSEPHIYPPGTFHHGNGTSTAVAIDGICPTCERRIATMDDCADDLEAALWASPELVEAVAEIIVKTMRSQVDPVMITAEKVLLHLGFDVACPDE